MALKPIFTTLMSLNYNTILLGAENENRTFGFNPLFINIFGCFSNSEVTHKERSSHTRLHLRATLQKYELFLIIYIFQTSFAFSNKK
jgi:hypothetical protein